MANALSWFEIPATDLVRAKTFYETILATSLVPMEGPGFAMAAFPADWTKGEVSGALAAGEGCTPGTGGTLVYLNGGADLQVVLARVPAAGGRILLPKTQIPMEGAGYMALFLDTEGNRVGLHSIG